MNSEKFALEPRKEQVSAMLTELHTGWEGDVYGYNPKNKQEILSRLETLAAKAKTASPDELVEILREANLEAERRTTYLKLKEAAGELRNMQQLGVLKNLTQSLDYLKILSEDAASGDAGDLHAIQQEAQMLVQNKGVFKGAAAV